MWRFSCHSERTERRSTGRLTAAASVVALVTWLAVLAGGTSRSADSQQPWWSSDLVKHLKATGWEPPYFAGTVTAFPEGHHLEMARRALESPTESVTIGAFTYRTSPPLVDAGREIFQHYHYGTHKYWDFRRAIDYATEVTDPATYSSRYGVKRDKSGRFVGIIGVTQPGGRTLYGHSCALCHANVDGSGEIVFGAPNHDFDLGLYYEALRPKIRDAEKVFLTDGALEWLRFQGPGRTDATTDSSWAPVKILHLFALRGLAHGLRSNGDTTNLWLQCYRNLNSDYPVDSDIMEALMAFLLSIQAPSNPRPTGEMEARGAAIFQAQRCHRCHMPPYHTSGYVIPWESIRTDPDRIENSYPKGYRVASLIRLDLQKYYLHDGSITSLEQLFDPARLAPSFQPPGIPEGRRKRGVGVRGHEFGMTLSEQDRAALVAFLRTL